MQEERQLLQQLPERPDLQCSWLLLSMCASPRANHALRTLSSPGGPKSWSEPGCGSPGKPWGRKGRSFRSSLANTTAPRVGAQDRRRLDLVVYGALSSGGAQCCDATLVSPLTRSKAPAAMRSGRRGGPQTLVVLGSEVGGRWNAQALSFVRDLVRLKAYRAPPAVRAAATAAWARRSMLSVAVQQAVASTALGGAWLQPLQPEAGEGPPLDSIAHLAAPEGHSRLPLRPSCRTAAGPAPGWSS